MLHQLADWTAINGEAIYGTRPWLVFGEGPMQVKGARSRRISNTAPKTSASRRKAKRFTPSRSAGRTTEKSSSSRSQTDDSSVNKIKRVELLGYQGKMKFTQTAGGLTVELPAQKLSDLTCSLKIMAGT